MRIGELAKSSGVSIDTLRWYDRIGLIRPARRNPISRFREYEAGVLDMLTLVKLAKVAGLTLTPSPLTAHVGRSRARGLRTAACGGRISES